MYVYEAANRKKNDFYVYVMEGYRENGRVKNRKVKSFGLKSVLESRRPGFTERLKRHYARLSDSDKLLQESRVNEAINTTAAIMDHRSRKDDAFPEFFGDAWPVISYALEPLRVIWHEDLKLDYKLNYLQKRDGALSTPTPEYDSAAIAAYLVLSRIVKPSSIKAAHAARGRYLGSGGKDFALHDCYRSLDLLGSWKDELISHINKRFEENYSRQYRMVFYDVTNFYFETALTDEDTGYADLQGYKKWETLLEPYLEQITAEDGSVDWRKLPADVYAQVKNDLFLRTRGLSKEHRYDLPLVSMVLMIDDEGLPVDFEIFSGRSSEYKTMREAIESLKQRHNITAEAIVADRGLNSAENINMLRDMGYGCIVAQKFSSLSSDFKSLHSLTDKDSYTIEYCTDDKGVRHELYRWKFINNFTKTGKNNIKAENCRLFITWSKNRYERDLAQLEADIARAEKSVKEGSKVIKKTRNWQSLVKTADNQGRGNTAVELNRDNIKKRKAECGFAAYVYRPALQDEVNGKALDPARIAASYHRLTEIENCFRILKTDLEIRPAYLSNPQHVRAHCLLCYMALCVVKVLLKRLENCGFNASMDSIGRALNDADVMVRKINDNPDNGLIFTKIYREDPQLSIERNDKRVTLSGAALYAHLKLHPEDTPLNINHIMHACGLKPLPTDCSRIGLSKCVKHRYASAEEMLSDTKLEVLDKLYHCCH